MLGVDSVCREWALGPAASQQVGLRESFGSDPAIQAEQVDMTITLRNHRALHNFIEHAIRSVEVPMSDAQDAAPTGATRIRSPVPSANEKGRPSPAALGSRMPP